MTTPTQANPSLGAFTAGYDPVAHTTGVALRVANIQTDTSVTPNVTYGDLGVDVTVSISPTANQRVNAQSGDFVAGSVVDLATLLAKFGLTLTADSTTRLQTSLYGKNAAAGDTPLLVDSGGRANIVQTIGGAAISASNALPVAQFIQQLIQNGQGFSATTGKQTSSGAGNALFALFNPASSSKNILIYSIMGVVSSNGVSQLGYITSDPALGTAPTIQNQALGNATTSIATVEYTSTVGSLPGTVAGVFGTPASTLVEVLQNGAVILLPKNSATIEGISIALSTSTNSYGMTVRWVEF